jgi:hypothetical protein
VTSLSDLEDLAKAATPGPWRIDGRHDYGDGSPYGIDCIENESGERIVIADCGVYPPHGATAEFIAALSPDVVLKLIEVARAADAWAKSDECDKFLPNKRREQEILDALAALTGGKP